MKIFTSILPLLCVLLLAACGCKKEEEAQYTPNPAIDITLDNIQSNTVVISVKSLNTDSVYGIVKTISEATPEAEEIEKSGVKAEEGKIIIGGLEQATEYAAYAVGKYGERFGKVVKVTFETQSLNSWEEGRTGILTFADLDLLPGGSLAKEPKYWDEARFLPHVTYRETNNTEKWLHEAFLLTDGQINGKLLCIDNGAESANQSDWIQFINYWFGAGQAVATLDATIGKAISRIGTPSFEKHKIVMTMPDPIMLQKFSNKSSSRTYWGKVNGRQLDFSNVSDQILAYKWFIDEVRTAWDNLAPQNLQLAGFYILSEILVTEGGFNYAYKRWDQILPSVSQYLHSMNYGLYWIPYYQADGYDKTKQLGIDYTWLQPNEYWDYPEKKQKKDWSWVFSTMKTYGHGMEIEFEGSHGEGGWSQYEEGVKRTSSSILSTVRTNNEAEGRKPGAANPYASRNRQLLRDYMNNFKEKGYYGKARIATYSGTNAMYELATSQDEDDRQMYLEYCRFIVNSPLRK